MVSFMCQIDLFENYLYSIEPCAKVTAQGMTTQ